MICGCHIWMPASIFPDDRAAWEALRSAEGRAPVPIHVVATRSGAISADSVVIRDPEIQAVIATTAEGAKQARATLGDMRGVEILDFGAEIDYRRLQTLLAASFGVRTLLSEAGPQVYGAMIADGAVDDEFLTLSPILVGSSQERPRPGLIEGTVFMPDNPPQSRLLSVRRSGDYLFLHSRYRDPA
jgi:riboflavin biosynthesis pyrimidine reductase